MAGQYLQGQGHYQASQILTCAMNNWKMLYPASFIFGSLMHITMQNALHHKLIAVAKTW